MTAVGADAASVTVPTADVTTAGRPVIDWLMNILLAVLITLALLCLVQLGYNWWHLGWY